MKKILVTFTLIASFAVLLTQCKEEEEKTSTAGTAPTNTTNSDFVKFGTAENIGLSFTQCISDAGYDMGGTQRADSNSTGAYLVFSFKQIPSAGTFVVKGLEDTSDLKINECEVYASKTGGLTSYTIAISGQVTVSNTNGKLRATASNLGAINESGETELLSGSVGCK